VLPNPSADVLFEFTSLWSQLQQFYLAPDQHDSLEWKFNPNGIYSASSAYRIQFEGRFINEDASSVWEIKIPPKCLFFTWMVTHNRCLTADNLAKKG
jgi:hypothetical protein